jgi:hypothetical protein
MQLSEYLRHAFTDDEPCRVVQMCRGSADAGRSAWRLANLEAVV